MATEDENLADATAALDRLASAAPQAVDPLIETAVGLSMLVAIIMLHGFGIRAINRAFILRTAAFAGDTPRWRVNLLLAAAVLAIAVLHLVETLLLALPLYGGAMLPTLRDSYYFALQSYTTLGDSGLRLPESWQLLGPMIAVAGLFTFGLTAGVLVDILSQIGRIDRADARRKQAAARQDP